MATNVCTAMQINYWTVGGFDGAVQAEKAIAEAKVMGYEGIELCFGAGDLSPGVTEKRCTDIRHAAEMIGIKLETMAAGNYWPQSFTSPDAAVRAKAVAFTKEYLQVARWIGAKTVLIIPGAVAVPWEPSLPVVPYQTAWDRATAGLKECVADAERLGVNMGLENVWNWFLADPLAMKAFIDQFNSPRVGSYFDVGNCIINGYPEHWIEILGSRIKAVHFKNFSRQDCGGMLHGFGDDLLVGDVNFEAVLAALEKQNYQGPITAEMIPFCRLPNLVLPDLELAKKTAGKLAGILGKK